MSCNVMPTACGICICNPSLSSVGLCAATASPGTPVCGGVGTSSCGMSTVTIAGSKPTVWPWVIAIGVGLWLLSRHHKG
jgi:hypothetical protein